jgi:hypothetical protein
VILELHHAEVRLLCHFQLFPCVFASAYCLEASRLTVDRLAPSSGDPDSFRVTKYSPTLNTRLYIHTQVKKLTDQDSTDYAKFYYYLCVLIECDLHEVLKSTFPGTWSLGANASFRSNFNGEKGLTDQTPLEKQQGAGEPGKISYLPTPLRHSNVEAQDAELMRMVAEHQQKQQQDMLQMVMRSQQHQRGTGEDAAAQRQGGQLVSADVLGAQGTPGRGNAV